MHARIPDKCSRSFVLCIQIKIAAEEQSKITKLRLLKLLQSIDYLSKL